MAYHGESQAPATEVTLREIRNLLRDRPALPNWLAVVLGEISGTVKEIRDRLPERHEPKRPVDGYWPEHCEQRAFVNGAKWWCWHASGATAFPSEVDKMEVEAAHRYGEPSPAPEVGRHFYNREGLFEHPPEADEGPAPEGGVDLRDAINKLACANERGDAEIARLRAEVERWKQANRAAERSAASIDKQRCELLAEVERLTREARLSFENAEKQLARADKAEQALAHLMNGVGEAIGAPCSKPKKLLACVQGFALAYKGSNEQIRDTEQKLAAAEARAEKAEKSLQTEEECSAAYQFEAKQSEDEANRWRRIANNAKVSFSLWHCEKCDNLAFPGNICCHCGHDNSSPTDEEET